VVVRKIN